jgi:hypothetical protein
MSCALHNIVAKCSDIQNELNLRIFGMLIKVMKNIGAALFYIGGIVWVVFMVAKYLLDCDVSASQFLPYHLCAIIPGMILKYGLIFYERAANIRYNEL